MKVKPVGKMAGVSMVLAIVCLILDRLLLKELIKKLTRDEFDWGSKND